MLPVRSDHVTAGTEARLPRQTLKQTRGDILDAGIRIVNEFVLTDIPREGDPPVDLLPFIRLEEVLEVASALARQRLVDEGGLQPADRVAPLTAGAFYKAFASEHQDGGGRGSALTAFHRLITRKMVEEQLVVAADVYIALGKDLASQGEPWTEVARLAVEMDFHRWASFPALILRTALGLYTRDQDVADWTRQIREKEIKELIRIYDAIIEVFDLRLRPGITTEHIAITVSNLVIGMALDARFLPETRHLTVEIDIDGRGKKQWHLCALAAWGIYKSFMAED